MAVIKTGPIVADIRGSVGDETFSRNQGGLYVKIRKGPNGLPSDDQLDCQATIRALSRHWSDELTEQQRTDWRTYAHQHPRRNRWGVPTLTNGYTRFIRINAHQYRRYPAVVFPNPPRQGPLYPPTFTFTARGDYDELEIQLPPPNYDPPPHVLTLFAFGGKNLNPGASFYAGPWRYIGYTTWDGDEWDEVPWEIEYYLDLVATKKLFLKLIAQHSDTGELSAPFQTSTIIT